MADYDHPAIVWTVFSKDMSNASGLYINELDFPSVNPEYLPSFGNSFDGALNEGSGTGYGYGYPSN
jgi:hypothetical protein